MKYRLPNESKNPWIDKCNELIAENENNVQSKIDGHNKYSLHHILIRSEHPELKDDKNNHLYLPVMDHIQLHYYMWKANPMYCAAFWFCYVYFHKNFGYTISDDEVIQLKEDMKQYRKLKKDKNTNIHK